jgi:hypothetical protein
MLYHPGEFITRKEAKEIAMDVMARNKDPEDPVFSRWSGSIAGRPLLVRTLSQDPSYWIVPLTKGGIPIGFIRILGTGRVVHMGIVHQESDAHRENREITGMTRREIEQRVARRFTIHRGEILSRPVFVHDGPVGREAWLVIVSSQSVPTRWLFITPSFEYERPAGTAGNEGRE